MKKIGLWIIGILVILYLLVGILLTHFSVDVIIKEQCWNENHECYKYCGKEKNKTTCLLFKQGYWKGIFLGGYSFIEAKFKDIFKSEEYSEYGLYNSLNEEIISQNIESENNITTESLIFSGDIIDVMNKNKVPVEIISLGKENNQYYYMLKVSFKDIFQSLNFKFTTNSEILNGDFELKDNGRRLLLKNGGLSITVRNNEIFVENGFSSYIQCYGRIKDNGISFPMFSGDVVKEGYEKDGEYFPTVTYSTINNTSALYNVNPYPFVMEPIKNWENNCLIELNIKETLSGDIKFSFILGKGFENSLYLIPRNKTPESDCKGASKFIGLLPEAESVIVETQNLACHIYYQDSLNNNFPKINELSIGQLGIQHNSEEGMITLDNGEESITIMDKNLGADVAGTGEESYGYYFQRGNNHGFQLNTEIKTGKDLVTRDVALQYGPDNWYDSDVQFVIMDNSEEVNRNLNLGNYFLAAVNDNLRGGSGDSEIVNRMGEYVIDQFRGDTGNPRTERKGPCPEGFHVPSFGEMHKLFKLWIYIKYPNDTEKKEHVRWMAIGGRGISTEFSNDLLLPKAGGIRFDGKGTPHDQDYRGYYWMSSPGRFLNFDNNGIVEYAESYRAATFPIRCFKD